MTSYVPPIKNGANGWIGYVSLAPRTATGAWQSNPTLASGDVKISIDGGSLANLTTLPAVTPASSKLVKITLSQAETNGDNLTIIFSDAAGAEWCDLTINLQTVARQIDDLAFPNTSGRGIDVSAGGEVGLDWANIGSPTTAQNLSGTNIDVDQVVASVSGAVGSVTGAVGSVTGNVGGNVVGSVGSVTGLTASNLDATISSRLASASYTAPDNTSITAIKAKTDNLPASPAATGDAMTLTSAYDFAKGTTAMTEAYAANGVAPTPIQAMYAIHQMLMQFSIASTTYTVKKLDNTTTAFLVTLNDATTPTSAVRT